MKTIPTEHSDVILLQPKIFGDERGWFFESFNSKVFCSEVVPATFIQDNHSKSRKHVLRGLHYQIQQPQGKLVRVIAGEVFDVAVDLRRNSPSFGKWTGVTLSDENKRLLWIPPGFAHGFLALSDSAEVLYKTTDYYAPEFERTIAWNDKDLAIQWPLDGEPIISAKDQCGIPFRDAQTFP